MGATLGWSSSQRSTTWAGDAPTRRATSTTAGSASTRPRSIGEYAWSRSPWRWAASTRRNDSGISIAEAAAIQRISERRDGGFEFFDVAAWSFALARALDRPNPDGAMLAGLMLDIGQFYLLARAARYPALEGDLPRFAELVALWDEPVRTAVLETFDLPDSIIEACTADPTARTEWPPESMSDIVFLATLAAEAPNPFDSLLGVERRPGLLEASLGGLEREAFQGLLDAARTTRHELIAAACD